MQFTPEQRQTILQAARIGIINALQGNTSYDIAPTNDSAMMQPAGCFVTLHELASHQLRGCIGRLQADQPLMPTLHEMAHSVIRDPRFVDNPVTLALLPLMDLEVSILSPLAPAATPLDFDPPNNGIYLLCNGRSGTFLPQVARDTGWGREQLLARLCSEKMGLDPQAWRNPDARLFTYTVEVIGPVPFGPVSGAPAVPPTSTFSGPQGLGGGNVFRCG